MKQTVKTPNSSIQNEESISSMSPTRIFEKTQRINDMIFLMDADSNLKVYLTTEMRMDPFTELTGS